MDLEEQLNKVVELIGWTQEAKGGPVLITKDNSVIYIKSLVKWPEEYLDKEIKIKGLLKREKFIPDPKIDENGGISQGAIGEQYTLENVKFTR